MSMMAYKDHQYRVYGTSPATHGNSVEVECWYEVHHSASATLEDGSLIEGPIKVGTAPYNGSLESLLEEAERQARHYIDTMV